MTQDLLSTASLDMLRLPTLINRIVRRGVAVTTAIDPDFQIELTPQQFDILFFLEHEGKHRIAEIGEKLEISKAQMTQVIDKLVKRGLIYREASLTDRRVINISLSSNGKDIVISHQEKLLGIMRQSLSGLSDSELLALSKTLQKATKIIKSNEK